MVEPILTDAQMLDHLKWSKEVLTSRLAKSVVAARPDLAPLVTKVLCALDDAIEAYEEDDER